MKINLNEKQDIEFKESWQDKYLEWICAFANAKGGSLFIGIADDGTIKGLSNSKKLMEDLPNKINQSLGIIVGVQLHSKKDLEYIQIDVPVFSQPISYKSRYFYRTGSTKQELTGASLTNFIIKKSGLTWDEYPEDNITIDDFDTETIDYYKELVSDANRFQDISKLTTYEVLDKLNLINDGKYKKAAVILFGKNPKRFYIGNSVQIGRFNESGSILIGNDRIEKNLLMTLKDTMEILKYKYLKFEVEILGIKRKESLEYPEEVLRETILNALIHRNYQSTDSIQIRITDSSLSIWSPGVLHPEITLSMLSTTHPSKPNNKLIADICFKAGLIESWGKGTISIIESNTYHGLQSTEIKEFAGGIQVSFIQTDQVTEQATDQATDQGIDQLIKALKFKDLDKLELMKVLDLNHKPHFNDKYIKPLLEQDLIEMTIPDKPKSPNQKYRLTQKGKKLL